jgi:hypothetical protein
VDLGCLFLEPIVWAVSFETRPSFGLERPFPALSQGTGGCKMSVTVPASRARRPSMTATAMAVTSW